MNFIKKNYQKAIFIIAFVCCIMFCSAITAHAAPIGTTMFNPLNANYGSVYTASWTRNTNNVFFYSRVNVDETGLLKMSFSKPYDSSGEYGNLSITVSDEDGEPLWSSDTYDMDKTASPYYKFNVGLKPGTYYVSIVPGFYVTSGRIETDFKFEFETNSYVEIEPNSSTSNATELKKGHFYSATVGNGGGDFGEINFFKVNLKKNSSYRLVIDNFGAVDETSAIIDVLGPANKDVNIYMGDFRVDSSGYQYYEFIAPSTGTYYVKVYNYSGKPIQYRLKVSNALKPSATKITNFYNWSWNNEIEVYFEEKENVAGYQLQYSSNKSKVKSAKIRSFTDDHVEIKVSKNYKKYYARVRTYKWIDGKKVYSKWSKIKCYY